MPKSVDGEYQYFFLEDVDFFGPPLHVFVIFLHLRPDLFHQHCSILLEDRLLFHILVDQLLQKKGREDIAFLVDLVGQEYELEEFEVIPNDCVVEVGIRPELVHVVCSDGKGFGFVEKFIA